jgi:hypothetical protein
VLFNNKSTLVVQNLCYPGWKSLKISCKFPFINRHKHNSFEDKIIKRIFKAYGKNIRTSTSTFNKNTRTTGLESFDESIGRICTTTLIRQKRKMSSSNSKEIIDLKSALTNDNNNLLNILLFFEQILDIISKLNFSSKLIEFSIIY